MSSQTNKTAAAGLLSARDLLAGSQLVHEIEIPVKILTPRLTEGNTSPTAAGQVRIRPLSVLTLTTISRAASREPQLVPILMIQQALVEPEVNIEQIKQMHIGLVHFLVEKINLISGLNAGGETWQQLADEPHTTANVLLAKHFGWTPEQVAQLTPGQVAVYLAGIEKLLQLEEAAKES